METRVKSLFFFPRGNTAVMNHAGQQIHDLQQSWLRLFFEFLQSKGVKVEEIEEIWMPDGNQVEYLKDVHSWRFK